MQSNNLQKRLIRFFDVENAVDIGVGKGKFPRRSPFCGKRGKVPDCQAQKG